MNPKWGSQNDLKTTCLYVVIYNKNKMKSSSSVLYFSTQDYSYNKLAFNNATI